MFEERQGRKLLPFFFTAIKRVDQKTIRNKNNMVCAKALFSRANIDHSWSFSDKTRKDTGYITHGYHRYPAKFIPQIVSRLVERRWLNRK